MVETSRELVGVEGVAWIGSLVLNSQKTSEVAGSGEEGRLAMGCPHLVTGGLGSGEWGIYLRNIISLLLRMPSPAPPGGVFL